MLANARDSLFIVAGKEPVELRIGGQTCNKVVGHGGKRIVSAEALVQRLLLLGESLRRRDLERSGRGECCQGEIQERGQFLHVLLLKGG